MRPMKTRGLAEVKSLRGRVNTLGKLGRIYAEDEKFLTRHLEAVENRINSMIEFDENGEELASEGF